MKKLKIDIPFLISVSVLVIGGFLIFFSASMGLLSTQAVKYSGVTFSQIVFGLFFGILACIITSRVDYKIYKKYAFYIFVFAILVNLLVFIPHIGVSINGASRWIYIGPISFQPSELLKFAFIIYLSAWFASTSNKATADKKGKKSLSFMYGLLPFVLILGVVGAILLKQPDTDTFLIICFSGLAIFLSSGGKWKHILILILTGLLGLAVIASMRPYVMSRITTFLNPSANALGSGYQIQQSLIAIGSGGLFGRGFGQSIQKFNFLPEPIGDSIFAVASEEFGFVGACVIILLFIFFAFRGLKIAVKTSDNFGRLVVVGIVIMIVSQAFVNIGAMVGVLPLSGIPLPFISHGGTALFATLAEVGIVFNISKSAKKA